MKQNHIIPSVNQIFIQTRMNKIRAPDVQYICGNVVENILKDNLDLSWYAYI